jgi:hypothetical protein
LTEKQAREEAEIRASKEQLRREKLEMKRQLEKAAKAGTGKNVEVRPLTQPKGFNLATDRRIQANGESDVAGRES